MLGNAFRDDEMVSRGRVPMCRYLAVSSAIENYRMRMESESCVYSFTLIPTVKKDTNVCVCVYDGRDKIGVSSTLCFKRIKINLENNRKVVRARINSVCLSLYFRGILSAVKNWLMRSFIYIENNIKYIDE